MPIDRNKTVMLVKELSIQDDSGDLVINVLATRGKREYKLPYHIKAANIAQVNRDYLMARVLTDVDTLIEQENKKAVIMGKLDALVGHEVQLD